MPARGQQLFLLLIMVGTASAFTPKSPFLDQNHPEHDCMVAALCRAHRDSNCSSAVFDTSDPHYHVGTPEAKMAYCSGCGVVPHSTEGRDSPPSWRKVGDARAHFSVELESTLRWPKKDPVEKQVKNCHQRRLRVQRLQDTTSSSTNGTFVSGKEWPWMRHIQTAAIGATIAAPDFLVKAWPWHISFWAVDSISYLATVALYWNLDVSNDVTDGFFETAPVITFMAMYVVSWLMHCPCQIWDLLEAWEPLKKAVKPYATKVIFGLFIVTGLVQLNILSDLNILVLVKSLKMGHDAYKAHRGNPGGPRVKCLVQIAERAFLFVVTLGATMFLCLFAHTPCFVNMLFFFALMLMTVKMDYFKKHLFAFTVVSGLVPVEAAPFGPMVEIKKFLEYVSECENHDVCIFGLVVIVTPAVILALLCRDKAFPATKVCFFHYAFLALILGLLKSVTDADRFILMFEQASTDVMYMLVVPFGDILCALLYAPCDPQQERTFVQEHTHQLVTFAQTATVCYYLSPIVDMLDDTSSFKSMPGKGVVFIVVMGINFGFKAFIAMTLHNTDLTKLTCYFLSGARPVEPPQRNHIIPIFGAFMVFALLLSLLLYVIDDASTVPFMIMTGMWMYGYIQTLVPAAVATWAFTFLASEIMPGWFLAIALSIVVAAKLLHLAESTLFTRKYLQFEHNTLVENYMALDEDHKKLELQLILLQAQIRILEAEIRRITESGRSTPDRTGNDTTKFADRSRQVEIEFVDFGGGHLHCEEQPSSSGTPIDTPGSSLSRSSSPPRQHHEEPKVDSQ